MRKYIRWPKNTVGWDTVQLDVACPSEVASQALNMGWRGGGGGEEEEGKVGGLPEYTHQAK